MVFDAGQLSAKLTLDSSDFEKGADKAGKSSSALNSTLLKYLGPAAIAATIGAGFAKAVKSAASFETTMTNVATLISGDSSQVIDEYGTGIKELLKTIPKNANELGAEAYNIVSAGISETGQALKVLESAGKLAVAGLGNTAGSTDILTSAINAFGLDANNADKISDTLFKTVKFGKTTVDQMAQAFGAAAPIIASSGIKLEDFSAATAALTTTGLPASQAQNSLRQAVVSLTKPTKEMTELIKAAGYASADKVFEDENLVASMQKIKEAANGNSETLAKAWGSVEALGAATALTSSVNEAYVKTLDDMMWGTNAVDEAFQKQTETVANQWALIKNKLNVVFINLGSYILPLITDAINWLTKKYEENKESIAWLTKKYEENKESIQKLFDYLKILMDYIKSTVMHAWENIKKVVEENREQLILFAKLIGGGVLIAITAFVGALGIVILTIGAAIEWILKIISVVVDFGKEMWNIVKLVIDAFKWLWNVLFGNSIIPDIIDGFVRAFTFIKDFVVGAVQSLVDGVIKIFDIFKIILFAYINLYKKTIFGIVDFVREIPSKIETILGWVWDKFQALVNKIKNIPNMIKDALDFTKLFKLPDIGGALSGIKERVSGALSNRESGGPVSAGVPYIVGEKRPEIFVPDRSGTILPDANKALGNTNLTINVQGGNFNEQTLAEYIMRRLSREQELAQRGVTV